MLRSKNSDQAPSRGFTVVELLIIAPIVILMIGGFITAIVSMTGEVLASRGSNVMAYNLQDALSRIEEDVKSSTIFLETNHVTLKSPQGLDDAVAPFSNSFNIVSDNTTGSALILNTIATTVNPLSPTTKPVYLADTPNACGSAQVSQNTPLTLNIIYFVKGTTLYRRTVAQSDYASAGCGGAPWQQASCSATVDPFCKVQDIKLIDNVKASDFVVQYYTDATQTTPNLTASDKTASGPTRYAALQLTATVGATITAANTIAGRDITQTGTIRATRLATTP